MSIRGVYTLGLEFGFAWATNDEAAQDRYVTEELLPRIEQRNGWTPEQLAVV